MTTPPGHSHDGEVFVLPSRSVFAELVAVALRAADAQTRPGCDIELRDDVVEVADALHRRLEHSYGRRDDHTPASRPPLGELMRLLADAIPPVTGGPGSEREDLAGLYLFLFLVQPRLPSPHEPSPARAALREVAAFAAGELGVHDALRVSRALLIDPHTRSRLWELLDVASWFSAAGERTAELDLCERMPDHVWQRALRTIAAAQREREHDDAGAGDLS